MTFTYTSDLTDAGDFVRFHTGDTVSAESLLSDEIISSLIAVEGTKEKAVIEGILFKINKLSEPDFSADWLSENNRTAIDSLRQLLDDKRAKFGLAKYTAIGLTTYRADSYATEPPDYSEGV